MLQFGRELKVCGWVTLVRFLPSKNRNALVFGLFFLFSRFGDKKMGCVMRYVTFAENLGILPLAIAALRKVFSNFVRFLVGLENYEKYITMWFSRLFVCGGVVQSTEGLPPGFHPAHPDER